MTISSKLFAFYFRAKTSPFRTYATIVERELEVPTFCDLHVDLPYNVLVEPLNVHKYRNCDKLVIRLDKRCEESLEYFKDGNQIKIRDSISQQDETILCSIKAPGKANLFINSRKNIKIGYFNGDKLFLDSLKGDIFVDKYQGYHVKLTTHEGDINLKEFIQASDIFAHVLESGSINSGRLQGLNLKLETNNGNISVESSYCNESHFHIENGNLDLNNTHKLCNIFLKEGTVNLVGFDGKLGLLLENGSADIHLSRITEDSEIVVKNGSLKLKLGDACQDYILFRVKSKECDVAENVKTTAINVNETTILTPDISEENVVSVNCVNGSVFIEGASWLDMMKLKLKK